MGAGASVPQELVLADCKKLAGNHWNAELETAFHAKKNAKGKIDREVFLEVAKTQGLIMEKKGLKKVARRNIVFAESLANTSFEHKNFPKTEAENSVLREALHNHFLFAKLEEASLNMILSSLEKKPFEPDAVIIQQGDSGDTFYVITEGTISIEIDGSEVAKLEAPHAFGELALIYGAPRAATVKAHGSCVCFSTDRNTFRQVLATTSSGKQLNRCEFLGKVPLLASLPKFTIAQIAEAMREVKFAASQDIVREGEMGDAMFVVWAGSVRVHKTTPDGVVDVASLRAGDYFGERSLLTHEARVATCTSTEETICLEITKQTFDELLGPLEELLEGMKTMATEREHELKEAEVQGPTVVKTATVIEKDLSEIKVIRTIGTGTFGRVKLVQHAKTRVAMAMKCLRKTQVVAARQQNNIMYEKNCMAVMDHPFVLKLHGTWQDANQLYMFMEIVQGGELWSLLYQKEVLPRTVLFGLRENDARFYTACTLAGFAHIHKQGYVYRDLKPENLLIDKEGHIRICDFGFAKKLKRGQKTQTLCGTPEYLAPELVLSRGHNSAVDHWALGVLIYELLCGCTPFVDPDQSRIFVKIVNSHRVLTFPEGLNTLVTDLVQKLLNPNAGLRLGQLKGGSKDIMDHKWFKGILWERLEEKEYKAPWKPKVGNPLDDSNFDYFDEDDNIPKYRGDPKLFKDF
eukprot:INCI17853.1.p1 GENE.INCI17853.1~~INCI17853.1.p1  ORF type:complete len:734 (-),score=129.93 INCI17853.1:213-2282(-)